MEGPQDMSLSVGSWSTKAPEPLNNIPDELGQCHYPSVPSSPGLSQERSHLWVNNTRKKFNFFVEIHLIHDFLETTFF